ncbi:MAG: hypothetical protein FJZ90_06000 [Chloroflexi bacterium]|nr:hypothetical protein [Chloroflexota bacterium]
MTMLHIALQEGFYNDLVHLRVNGVQVYAKESVRTRFQIGYADACEVDVSPGAVRLEVLLPQKNMSRTLPLEISAPTYVGVSLEGDAIACRVSDQPFGYL